MKAETGKNPKNKFPHWQKADGQSVQARAGFGLIGILNINPDSFYEASRHPEPTDALKAARTMLLEGADVIDLGAESTRPGAAPLDAKTEQRRLLPALALLRQHLPEATISIDTYHASTAIAALERGAAIINDISACQREPALLEALAQFRPACVLMHGGHAPLEKGARHVHENIVDEVKDFFERQLSRYVRAGVPESHMALDPGFGFAKNLEHNLALIRHLEELRQFGRPILAGVSMKSMFGQLLGQPAHERAISSAISSALLFQKGAQWHRVHHVALTRDALALAHALST